MNKCIYLKDNGLFCNLDGKSCPKKCKDYKPETGGKMSEVIEVVCKGNCEKCSMREFGLCFQVVKGYRKKIHKGDRIKIEIIREGK